MSNKILSSREAQARVAEAMDRYRAAWRAVEAALAALPEDNEAPRWVFALDRMPIEELGAVDPRLVPLETRRRRARVALHALVELIALQQLPGVDDVDFEPSGQGGALASLLSTDEASWRSGLDGFIGIVDQARDAGVIYVNGTFVPVDPPSAATGAE